jgi:hypothetical protein
MTKEELDSIDAALRAIVLDAGGEARAQDVARRFNEKIQAERSALAAVRALADGGTEPSVEAVLKLRAAAVMWAEERTRIIRRFGLRH